MKVKFIKRALLFSLLFGVLLMLPASAQTNLPSLRMTLSNGVNTVFWPLTAYFDILQTATDLSPTASWTNLATGELIVASVVFPEIGRAHV